MAEYSPYQPIPSASFLPSFSVSLGCASGSTSYSGTACYATANSSTFHFPTISSSFAPLSSSDVFVPPSSTPILVSSTAAAGFSSFVPASSNPGFSFSGPAGTGTGVPASSFPTISLSSEAGLSLSSDVPFPTGTNPGGPISVISSFASFHPSSSDAGISFSGPATGTGGLSSFPSLSLSSDAGFSLSSDVPFPTGTNPGGPISVISSFASFQPSSSDAGISFSGPATGTGGFSSFPSLSLSSDAGFSLSSDVPFPTGTNPGGPISGASSFPTLSPSSNPGFSFSGEGPSGTGSGGSGSFSSFPTFSASSNPGISFSGEGPSGTGTGGSGGFSSFPTFNPSSSFGVSFSGEGPSGTGTGGSSDFSSFPTLGASSNPGISFSGEGPSGTGTGGSGGFSSFPSLSASSNPGFSFSGSGPAGTGTGIGGGSSSFPTLNPSSSFGFSFSGSNGATGGTGAHPTQTSEVVIDGSTVTLPTGTDLVTLTETGTTIIIGTGGIIEGSSTIPLPTGTGVLTTDGLTFSAEPLPSFSTTPAPTDSSGLPIGTFSTFPTQPPITLSGTTDITTGTHTTSSSTRSDGGIVIVTIPIIPGHDHGCWFCPPGPPGFELPGFTLPGIYPGGGPPAGFPTPFPPITIDPQGDPTFPKSEEPTTTKSCRTVTKTGCSTFMVYSVDSAGTTTATSTSSSCSTVRACSATASDTTSHSTTSSAGGCWKYNLDPFPSDGEEADEALVQRDVAGRIHYNVFEKRARDPARKIGACVLQTKQIQGKKTIARAKPITTPDYPGPGKLEAHPTAGATWWYVPTLGSAGPGSCPTLGYSSYPNAAALTAQPVMTNVVGTPKKYNIGGANGDPYVNTDHVYELKFMIDFWTNMLNQGYTDCTQINDFFMDFDTAAGPKVPRLQTLWNQLPSDWNPDFVGMDRVVNDVKGKLLSPNLQGLPGTSDNPTRLNLMYNMLVAIAMTNDQAFADRFAKTNSRIYAAFLGVDDLVNRCGVGKPKKGTSPWSDLYKNYMTNLITAQNAAIVNKMNQLIGQMTATVDNSGKRSGYGISLDSMTQAYPSTDAWTFNAATLLTWDKANTLNIQKRDNATAPACAWTPGAGQSSIAASTSNSIDTLTPSSAVPSSTVSGGLPPNTAASAAPTIRSTRDLETIVIWNYKQPASAGGGDIYSYVVTDQENGFFSPEFCNTLSIAQSTATSDISVLPTSMDGFSSNNFGSCSYSGTDSEAGTLTCDDRTVTCSLASDVLNDGGCEDCGDSATNACPLILCNLGSPSAKLKRWNYAGKW